MTVSLVRIDDRLIHGQVVMTWLNHTDSNTVHIVDDEVAVDAFMQQILVAAAPSGVNLSVYGLNAAIEHFKEWQESEKRILILVRHPKTVETMIDNGAQIDTINLGGLRAAPDKRTLYRNISVSDEEQAVLQNILDKGVSIFIQMIATEGRTELIPKMLKS